MVTLDGLINVTKRIELADLEYALGGSGLLYALGLASDVRDWDITTDRSLVDVQHALNGIDYELKPQTDLYASDYLLWVPACDVEIIGRYRLRSPTGICEFPVRPAGRWGGVPLASVEVWAIAYEMMDRTTKAQLLFDYIRSTGINMEVLYEMLQQPLPDDVREKVVAELKLDLG